MPEIALLSIHALTGLHPGSGTALGVVDLPVQRERHTQWPTIPGSSLKGILRETCRRRDGDDRESLLAAFGPEPGAAHDHAGALSITDAKILAFPVRSLRGVFAWVTCPAAVGRLRRDLELAGIGGAFEPFEEPGETDVACTPDSPLLIDGDRMILEEFEFTRTGDAGGLGSWIASNAIDDSATRERMVRQLVVLNDNDFTHFVRHATEVVARIGLDYERKTVKKGALFYEEFLPPETLFYSLAISESSRKKGRPMSPGEVLAYVRERLPRILQIGGDETIGKGLCAVRLMNGSGIG